MMMKTGWVVSKIEYTDDGAAATAYLTIVAVP